MPVERGGTHAGRGLAVSTLIVVLIFGVLYGVAMMASRQDALDTNLGSQEFQGGKAERLAKEISDRGPILYSDVSDSGSGKNRDMILQHLGDDPEKGWYAFRAQPSNKGRECAWVWRERANLFQAKCDKAQIAPADGKGLESYPVKVTNGRIRVDLNFDRRTTTTTTTTTAPISGKVPSTSKPAR